MWLGAFIAAPVLAKAAGVPPDSVDELPLHIGRSSIDDSLSEEKAREYTELAPFDIMLDEAFYFIRDDLGFSAVTRFVSKRIEELFDFIQQHPARRQQGPRSRRPALDRPDVGRLRARLCVERLEAGAPVRRAARKVPAHGRTAAGRTAIRIPNGRIVTRGP